MRYLLFHMDTHRLKYFCTVSETGSLTIASEMLGISHSGLSKAISTLETETSLKLFQPKGRGLEITNEGKWLYLKAKEILKIESEISLGAKKETKSLRIGLPEVLSIHCTALVANVVRDHITVMSPDLGELETKILEGQLDFGYAFSIALHSEFDYIEIGSVEFNAFASHTFLVNRKIDGLYFTVPESHVPFNPLGFKSRDGWPHEVPRISKFAVSSFAVGLDLLKSGKSVLFMPAFISDLENQKLLDPYKILRVPHFETVTNLRRLFLVKRKESGETEDMKKISKIFRKICCH